MAVLDSGTIKAVIRLLARTANAADEADDLSAALAVAIDEIACFAGWPVGHAYVPSSDNCEVLVSAGIWHLEDKKRYRAFKELSEATKFSVGVGLPGRVLKDRKPFWINDLAADENFPRARQGVEIGLKAGFAVPVLINDEVAAVMEFFSPEPVAADSYLLTLMEEVGKRLGLIFERRRALETIRRQALVTDQVSEAVLISDFEGRILDCNAGAEISFGFTREELLTMEGRDLAAEPDDWDRSRADVLRIIDQEGRWNGILQVRRKDGNIRTFDFSLTTFRDAHGQHTATLAVGRDITEREEATRSLKQQALALAQLSEAVFVTDLNGRIIDCNRAAEAMYGRSRDNLIGIDGAELAADADAWRAQRQKLYASLDAEGPRQSIVDFNRGDGSVGISEFSIASLQDEHGKRIAHVCTARDITERMDMESQLIQAQKMEVVGQLTGGLAHDFNNLLTAILGNLEMVEDRIKDDPKTMRMIDTAINATLKGANLTQQLLAFSRKQPLQPKRVVLNELIPRMRELMARTLGEAIEIEIALPEEELAVRADPSQLESAVLNLGINARDAMLGGGRLRIEAALANPDQLPDELTNDDTSLGFVVIEVSDNGSGMTPSVLERAFEPFFTTKEVGAGSGLGLSMVYGFAKQSGGHVDIESKPGSGSRVRVFLPEAEAGMGQEEPCAGSKAVDHDAGAATVLVVEDDAAVREYASNVFTSLGYSVVAAVDGKDAVALMQGAKKIDLLFTDIVLPGGMDGGQLADHFRAAWPQGEILFTSGFTRQAIEKKGGLTADQRLLSKPYRRKDLVAALDAVFGS